MLPCGVHELACECQGNGKYAGVQTTTSWVSDVKAPSIKQEVRLMQKLMADFVRDNCRMTAEDLKVCRDMLRLRMG